MPHGMSSNHWLLKQLWSVFCFFMKCLREINLLYVKWQTVSLTRVLYWVIYNLVLDNLFEKSFLDFHLQ